MKPDLICCWIKHCDYPLFRQFLKKHRDFFGKVIIYWSEHFRDMYYDKFIEEDLKDYNITFLQSVEYKYGVEDWRNVATNEMLKYSNSEWVCSIEQDWFCKDWDALLSKAKVSMTICEMFGWWNNTAHSYIHPAFWFIKRSLLEQTSKDFSAHPEVDGSDHFGQITYDVQKLGKKIDKYSGEFSLDSEMFHLGGVNQNYINGLQEDFVFHRPDVFNVYNYWSTKVKPQDPQFLDLCMKIEKKLNLTPNIEWDKFFKWES